MIRDITLNLQTVDWTDGVGLLKIELIRVCALLSPYTNWIRHLTEAKFLSGTVKVILIFLRAMTPNICLVAGFINKPEKP